MCKTLTLNIKERIQLGRNTKPNLLLVDYYSVNHSPTNHEVQGMDGNKKVNGRKRQILVDEVGCIGKSKVHATHQHDGVEGIELLENITEQIPRVK